MAINYIGQDYGIGGGPTLQQVRESTPLSTSSFQYTNITGLQDILPDASSAVFTGETNENAYYLIWGYSAGNTADNAFAGALYGSNTGHAEGTVHADDFATFAVTRKGPCFVQLSIPFKVADGASLKLDILKTGGAGNTDVFTVFYTRVAARS